MEAILQRFFQGPNFKHFSTPGYLYFPEELDKNIRVFNKLLENDIEIFYALKANNYEKIVSKLIINKFGFDVASKEEISYIKNLGASSSKITFSAPSKKEEDIQYAASLGIPYYAFDSYDEILKIMKNVPNPILIARMAQRSKNAVFNLSSKFGMNEEYFEFIVKKSKKNKWPLKGITFHVGSQNVSYSSWQSALKHVEKLLKITKENNIDIEYINLGGGLPSPYSNKILPIDFYVEKIIDMCIDFRKKFPSMKLMIEPGRSMCANTMALVTKVIDYKPYKKPPIIVTDTGVFNGIIEPIEHLEYPVFLPENTKVKKRYYRIVGFSCEGYDIIRSKVLLPESISIGDTIAFMYAGAYTFVYEKFHMVSYPTIRSFDEV